MLSSETELGIQSDCRITYVLYMYFVGNFPQNPKKMVWISVKVKKALFVAKPGKTWKSPQYFAVKFGTVEKSEKNYAVTGDVRQHILQIFLAPNIILSIFFGF